jgi:hypothetical protein
MKIAKVLESGVTGAATLNLLRESLQHVDPKGPGAALFRKKGMIRQLKKGAKKKGIGAVKVYVQLAAELLGVIGYMGISVFGKRKNTLLRGATLGGLAGAIALLMNSETENDDPGKTPDQVWRKRALVLAAYLIAGLAAGGAVKALKKKKKKK